MRGKADLRAVSLVGVGGVPQATLYPGVCVCVHVCVPAGGYVQLPFFLGGTNLINQLK